MLTDLANDPLMLCDVREPGKFATNGFNCWCNRRNIFLRILK